DDRRLEGDETVNLTIGSLSSTLSGQVSLSDTTHTATIEDNEVGTINFQADQSNAERVSPTVTATLTITRTGSGSVSLDTALTVSATEAGGGSATSSGTDYSFSTTSLTFAADDGNPNAFPTRRSSDLDDRRLEGDETVNL